MTPTIVLLLAAVAVAEPAAPSQPSTLPAEARALQSLARSALGRAFLKAPEGAPPYTPRTVYRRGKAREWINAATFAKLAAAHRAKHREALREAKSALEMSRYYEEARDLSHRITTWALTLGPRPRRFVICSGGGPGIMEAANRGASEAGGKSIGLSIELPHEQFANAYISPELSLNFHYFFMRKLWFAQIAKALIVFPGGFGTMDELWEMLTLLQTGKLPRNNLIIIYGRKYWDEVLNFRAMVRWGMINQDEYNMLQFADTVDEAFNRIREGLEKYHMKLDSDL